MPVNVGTTEEGDTTVRVVREGDGVASDVTAVIKTFERPEVLGRLIASIRKYYPELRILVADDSRFPCIRRDVDYYTMPFDSGLSAGRNLLVERVKTRYTLVLDDDFVFFKDTKIEKLHDILESSDIDLVGGVVLHQNRDESSKPGLLELQDGVLRYQRDRWYSEELGCKICDVVPNFFMARTGALRRVKWDDALKIAEHKEFFLRAKGNVKVASCDHVKVMHQPERTRYYNRYRNRGQQYWNLVRKKHQITSVESS
jgi:glycosyltransferase involved in cell wall biosynthesis